MQRSIPRLLVFALLLLAAPAIAQERGDEFASDVLTDEKWEEVTLAVDRALAWLAREQQPDGSFPTLPQGQPGVTSLCTLAFMAHGHIPGQGPYGENLDKAIDYILRCQKRNGLLAFIAPNGETLSRDVVHEIGFTAAYNHAISALALSEAYAMEGERRAQLIQPAILKALNVSLVMQNWPKDDRVDEGGWRYLDDYDDKDSDLSITGWELMFLRSAKNAGFDVPAEPVERAVVYVRRCFLKQTGAFTYKIVPQDRSSRGMAGAGVLALAHAGMHDTLEAQRAGDWILRSGFEHYNTPGRLTGSLARDDRYHYGLLTCCQAMYQLGGHYWADFFPGTVEVLLSAQRADGSWEPENHLVDSKFGNAYTTAICVLALGSANQLLPVFQR
jgi:Prenyltransferase and squalene oxidase repeat